MGIVSDAAYAIVAVIVAFVAITLLLSIPIKILWRTLSIVSFLNLPATLLPIGYTESIGLSGILRSARQLTPMLRRMIPWLLIALTIISLLMYTRSSTPNVAVFSAIGLATLFTSIALASGAVRQGIDVVRLTVLPIAPIAIVQAVSTIVFRFSPTLEETYLRSAVASFLLGDDARLLYTTRPNNVTDPLKAGGILFVNGNRASMVMAVLALLYLSLWIRRRSFTLFVLFAVCIAGELTTSSKTALVLSISIPFVFLILPNAIRSGRRQGTAVAGVLALSATGVGLWLLYSKLPSFIAGTDEAAQSRSAIFAGWITYFREHPIAGLGFGGWAERWARDAASYGSSPRYPPHNFLLLEWANTGLVGCFTVIALMLALVWGYLKLVRRAETSRDARVLSLQLGAIVWIFLHGMYDNTSFYGTSNTLIIFAALIAQMLVLTDERTGRVASEGRYASGDLRSATPARLRGGRIER
ncbi:O-antigen ligase family protein [Microbacterium soli]|uniref:O-antigen ligase-related domain-containing protein n=1 Tax=Microbacterium soli TaxID=446075 RepID=A0ABP7MUZ9_9MICO